MYHSCAVTAGGQVTCWGANWSGQLGDGTTTTRISPTTVAGLDGVVALAQGAAYHSCALRYDGTVWCWGSGSSGQLGDGRWQGSTRPVQVAGLTDATALVGGFYHTCAIDSAGRARCWGSTPAFSSPTPIAIDGLSGVTAIGGGGNHTCALTEDGVGYCSGMNYYGALGDGTTADHAQPAPVIGL